MSTESCEIGNSTVTSVTSSLVPNAHQPQDVHWLFRISFLYFSVISSIIFCLVAIPVSHITTPADDHSYQNMDQRMLAPFMRDPKLYAKQMQQREEKGHQMQQLLVDSKTENEKKDNAYC